MRFLFMALVIILAGSSVRAQQMFPELDAKFQPPQNPATVQDTPSPDETGTDSVDSPDQDKHFRIQLENIQGALPYARTLSYCAGTAVLTNETKQPLQVLSLTLTYGDMPAQLSFGGVQPNATQSRPVMLIGSPCESFLNMPEVEIQSCRWGAQPEAACKKKVKFIPPNS